MYKKIVSMAAVAMLVIGFIIPSVSHAALTVTNIAPIPCGSANDGVYDSDDLLTVQQGQGTIYTINDINFVIINYGKTCPIATPVATSTPGVVFGGGSIGHEVGAGGILPVGFTICNPFASTCYLQLENGASLIYPNPNFVN